MQVVKCKIFPTGRPVTLRTPVPTLDQVGDSLGLSKAKQRSLLSIVRRDSESGVFAEKVEAVLPLLKELRG